MIITTTENVAGHDIVRTLGLVRGTSVRGRAVGADLMAYLRNAVGGEIHEYTKMMAEVREQALDRMIEEASQLGANAIIAVRFSTSASATGTAEFLVYGTGVVVSELPE